MKNLFGLRFAQIVLAIAGTFHLLVGVALLFAPVWFFQNVGHFPPFNRHYEGDLGAFILPLGVGLLVATRAPGKYKGLIWAVAAANLLHVANHVYDALVSQAGMSEWFAEIGPLLLLALLLILAVVASGNSSVEARRA